MDHAKQKKHEIFMFEKLESANVVYLFYKKSHCNHEAIIKIDTGYISVKQL